MKHIKQNESKRTKRNRRRKNKQAKNVIVFDENIWITVCRNYI